VTGLFVFSRHADGLFHGRFAMLAKLKTYALVGIDAITVEVEVDAAAGLPKTVI